MPIDSLEEFSYNLIWNCTPRREPCIALSQLRCTDTNTILVCVPRLKPSKFRSIQSNWLDFNPHTITESISTLTLKSGQFLSPAQTPSPFDSNTEIMSIYISNLKSSQYRCATKTNQFRSFSEMMSTLMLRRKTQVKFDPCPKPDLFSARTPKPIKFRPPAERLSPFESAP